LTVGCFLDAHPEKQKKNEHLDHLDHLPRSDAVSPGRKTVSSARILGPYLRPPSPIPFRPAGRAQRQSQFLDLKFEALSAISKSRYWLWSGVVD
jgi:hypothetical protein